MIKGTVKTPPPKWAFDAYRLHFYEGVPRQELARKFGKHITRVGQVIRQIEKGGFMPDRKFEEVRNYKPKGADKLHNGYLIRCAHPGCNAVEYHVKPHGVCNPTHTAQVFRNKGWFVGGGPKADRCPEHAKKLNGRPYITKNSKGQPPKTAMAEAMRKAREEKEMPYLKQDEIAAKPIPPAPVKADPPREMKREDRRIVFAKLEEVYLDEKTGYDKGWDDHRVAQELGCPRAWVEKIRDENFGPDMSAERREMLGALRAKIDAITSVGLDLKKAKDDFDHNYERFQKMSGEIKALEAKL